MITPSIVQQKKCHPILLTDGGIPINLFVPAKLNSTNENLINRERWKKLIVQVQFSPNTWASAQLVGVLLPPSQHQLERSNARIVLLVSCRPNIATKAKNWTIFARQTNCQWNTRQLLIRCSSIYLFCYAFRFGFVVNANRERLANAFFSTPNT